MRQNTKNELTAPTPRDVALHKIHDKPNRTFLLTLLEKSPAKTPNVEYEELKRMEAIKP